MSHTQSTDVIPVPDYTRDKYSTSLCALVSLLSTSTSLDAIVSTLIESFGWMGLLQSVHSSKVQPTTANRGSSLCLERKCQITWVSPPVSTLICVCYLHNALSPSYSSRVHDIYVQRYGRSMRVWGPMPVGWVLPTCRCPISYSVMCSRVIYVSWHWILGLFNMSWQIRRYTKNHGKYVITFQTCSETVFSRRRDISTNVSDVLLHPYSPGSMFKDFYLSSSPRATSWKKSGWV